ncbi:MAG: TetR/AcrR family transcriptional regulator [Psychroflexus sp.]
MMKNQIIQKATEMFLELGFKSVTMDDLAQALSVSKKTIYDQVGKKSILVEMVVQRMITEINTEMACVFNQKYNAVSEMIAFRDILIKRLKNQKSSPQFQLKKYYSEIYDKYREELIEIIEQNIQANLLKGIEEGFYHKDLNLDFVVKLYIAGLLDLKNEEFLRSERYTPKQLYHEFVLYHMRSMTTPKGQKKLNEILNA